MLLLPGCHANEAQNIRNVVDEFQRGSNISQVQSCTYACCRSNVPYHGSNICLAESTTYLTRGSNPLSCPPFSLRDFQSPEMDRFRTVASQVAVQEGSTALQTEARGEPPMPKIPMTAMDQISTNCKSPPSAASKTSATSKLFDYWSPRSSRRSPRATTWLPLRRCAPTKASPSPRQLPRVIST